MRELILKRIDELFNNVDGHYNACRLLETPSKRRTEKKILADGRYPNGFDFNTLSDEDLVDAFEKIIHAAYKQC